MPSSIDVQIRRAKPEDAQLCGQICYDAFYKINTDHNFPSDLPSPEVGIQILSHMFSDPRFYCVVAETDGRIVGSNCLDERDTIRGIGPITINPNHQNRAVGRKLMEAVLDRTREHNAPGVRLVQAAFHNRSLSLYTKLGFAAREPLSIVNGTPLRKHMDGFAVRPAQIADLEACNRICLNVHGHNRSGELSDAIQHQTRPRRGAQWKDYRVLHRYGFLWSRRRRDEPGSESPNRIGGSFRRRRDPGPHPQRRPVPLVSRQRLESRRADDLDVHRPLQRTLRRLSLLYHLLTGNLLPIPLVRYPKVVDSWQTPLLR